MSEAQRLEQLQQMVAKTKAAFPEVPVVGPEEVARAAADDVVVVDVREDHERAVSGIPGAISRAEFERRAEELAGSRVISYCTIGYRSSDFARALRADGWDAANFEGSILRWTHAGGELVDPQGNPTRKVHVFGKRWNLAADGYEPVW